VLKSGGIGVTGGNSDELLASSKRRKSGELVTQVPQTIVGSGLVLELTGTGTAAAKTAAGGTKILGMDPVTLGLLGMTAYGGGKGLEENKEAQRLYEQQLAANAEEQRRKKGAGYDAYARSGWQVFRWVLVVAWLLWLAVE
jgi:hypothetical protein